MFKIFQTTYRMKVYLQCIGLLDLSFNKSDLEEIEKEGSANMENAYADGVIESLSLFGEMLGFSPPSKAFKMCHCEIIGDLTKKRVVKSCLVRLLFAAWHIIH